MSVARASTRAPDATFSAQAANLTKALKFRDSF